MMAVEIGFGVPLPSFAGEAFAHGLVNRRLRRLHPQDALFLPKIVFQRFHLMAMKVQTDFLKPLLHFGGDGLAVRNRLMRDSKFLRHQTPPAAGVGPPSASAASGPSRAGPRPPRHSDAPSARHGARSGP